MSNQILVGNDQQVLYNSTGIRTTFCSWTEMAIRSDGVGDGRASPLMRWGRGCQDEDILSEPSVNSVNKVCRMLL